MTGLHTRFTVELYGCKKNTLQVQQPKTGDFKKEEGPAVEPKKYTAIEGKTKRGFLSQNKSDRGQI